MAEINTFIATPHNLNCHGALCRAINAPPRKAGAFINAHWLGLCLNRLLEKKLCAPDHQFGTEFGQAARLVEAAIILTGLVRAGLALNPFSARMQGAEPL